MGRNKKRPGGRSFACLLAETEGAAHATPAGVNPYVSYVNDAAVTTTSLGGAAVKLVVSPLTPSHDEWEIVVPGSGCGNGHRERNEEDDDLSLDDWFEKLGQTIGHAILKKMDQVLQKVK